MQGMTTAEQALADQMTENGAVTIIAAATLTDAEGVSVAAVLAKGADGGTYLGLDLGGTKPILAIAQPEEG